MATGVEFIEREPVSIARSRWPAVVADPRWTLYGGLVVLNLLDVITTAMVIDRGGAERNPFVQPFVHDMRLVTVLKVLVLVIVATLLTRVRDSRLATLALAGTTGWYLAVVSWNTAVLALM